MTNTPTSADKDGKHVLVLNFGSTSTKVAVFRDGAEIARASKTHDDSEIRTGEGGAIKQLPMRLDVVESFLGKNGLRAEDMDVIVARTGVVIMPGNAHLIIDDKVIGLIEEMVKKPSMSHVSHITPIAAYRLAKGKALAVAPESHACFDFIPEILFTGIPGISWFNGCHTENLMAVTGLAARKLGKPIEQCRLIVAHLGGGFSIAYIQGGKIKATLGDGETAFTPERAGIMPAIPLIELCYSGKYTMAEAQAFIKRKGGLLAHLGTTDCVEVERRIREGDGHAAEVYRAMLLRISMGIGEMAAVGEGRIDAIVLTGGMAGSDMITEYIEQHTGYIAPLMRFPGEYEMAYFAKIGFDILEGRVQAIHHPQGIITNYS